MRPRAAAPVEFEPGVCDCEHESHFDDDGAHGYRDAGPVTPIKTMFGTFELCPACLSAGHGSPGAIGDFVRPAPEDAR